MRLPAVVITTLALLSFAPCGVCQTTSAKQHFAAGVKHAEAGDFYQALQDFEKAYAVRPHFSVLFNIAQAHAALRHPVEAQRAFERYLLEGGKAISETRREQVRSMLAQQRAQLGNVELVGLQPETRIWVDGHETDADALTQPIPLAAGSHTIISSQGIGFPTTAQVEVRSGEVTKYEPPIAVAAPAVPRPATGTLRATCQVPHVGVEIDGKFAFTTPHADGVEVEVGERTVAFSRPGYAQTERTVLVAAGRPTSVSCDLYALPTIPADMVARLAVRSVPTDAHVFLDGRRWRDALVPFGAHTLRVERDGFVPEERSVVLVAGKTLAITMTLTPTLATRRAEAETKRRRFLAYSSAAGGVAFTIAGGVVLAWNGTRYDDWRAGRQTASAGEQLQAVASIQRTDDVGVGALALGVGLLATSTWLLLSSPAPTLQAPSSGARRSASLSSLLR